MLIVPIKVQLKRFHRRTDRKDRGYVCRDDSFKSQKSSSKNKRLPYHRGEQEKIFNCPNILDFFENPYNTSVFFNDLENTFKKLYQNNKFTLHFGELKKIGILECVLLNCYITKYLSYQHCGLDMGGSRPKDNILNFLIYTFAFKPLEGKTNIEIRYKSENLDENIYFMFEGNKRNVILKDAFAKELVDFFNLSLKSCGLHITIENASNLINAVTEIIGNAQEHQPVIKAKHARWWGAGYYDKKTKQCSFMILNFGSTISETLLENVNSRKEINRHLDKNQNMYKLLTDKLKQSSTELAVTILGLQDGISSKKTEKGTGNTRGKGLMSFLEFINKVGIETKIAIVSGKALLKIDFLKYRIVEDSLGRRLSFNESNNLNDLPDTNVVGYLPNSFNGTFITGTFKIENSIGAGNARKY